MTDVDGNTFIDFAGGIGCLAVGHSNARRRGRGAGAGRALPAHRLHDHALRLATSSSPSGCARALPITGATKAAFFNSGAEAVENAVKIAKAATGRPAVIAYEGAFHGRTHMAMSLTSKQHPYKAGFGPFAPEVYRVAYPVRVPLAGRRRRVGRRARRPAPRLQTRIAPESGGRDRDRADPGRGRLRARARRVPARPARDLRRARHRADRRRGADGLRPHRHAVRDRAVRRRARPRVRREVDRRRPAALRRARARRDHGRARRLGHRRHVRRQPGRAAWPALAVLDEIDRLDLLRPRARDRRGADAAACAACRRACRSSATCAGSARWSASSSCATRPRASPRPSSRRASPSTRCATASSCSRPASTAT